MSKLEPKDVLDSIEFFIRKIENETKENARISDILKGWKVYYSPVFQNPKILFIGINPGAGELNDPFVLDRDVHDKLHYLEVGRNNFQLAKSTIQIFENISATEVLENDSVKINSKFYATRNVQDMYEFEFILKNNYFHLWEELMTNNVKWLGQIINYISPKVIVCEGKEAFEYLDEKIFTDVANWSYPLNYEDNKICGYFIRKSDNLILFGYSRKRGLNQNLFISKQLKIALDLIK